MTEQIAELRTLLDDPDYNALLVHVAGEINREIDRNVLDVVLELDVEQLIKSGVGVSELAALVSQEAEQVASFAITKFSALEGREGDVEFPVDETPPQSEQDILEKELPIFSDFLVSYMIEYILVKNYPERLNAYLRAMRFPAAKQYAGELKLWVGATLG